MEKTGKNGRRIKQGGEAVKRYTTERYFRRGKRVTRVMIESEGECPTIDLMADMLHYAKWKGWDTERIVRMAVMHFNSEVRG